MSGNKISFNEFLNLEPVSVPIDCGAQVKSSPKTVWSIPAQFGSGRILTMPLVGGAGLVLMECCFNRDIEIYTEQNKQENLSLTLCLKGGLVSCSQGRKDVVIGQNETLFARSTEIQNQVSSRFQGSQDCVFITIQLSEDWLKSDPCALTPNILNNSFWQGVYNSGTASHLMLTVAYEIVNAIHCSNVESHYISAKVLELWSHELALLKRLSPEPSNKTALNAKDIAPIHRAAEILSKEMVNPPSLLELSRRIGINDNKLKTTFKQVYGVTVFNYLHRHRLQKAKVLISEHQCTVTQAANAVGFSSASHFSNVFKQAFGLTPRQLLSTQPSE